MTLDVKNVLLTNWLIIGEQIKKYIYIYIYIYIIGGQKLP